MRLQRTAAIAAFALLAISGACATTGETENEDASVQTDINRPAVMDTMARDTTDTMTIPMPR